MDSNNAAIWVTGAVSTVAILSTVLNAWLDRRHQRKAAESAWIRDRRAAVYVPLVRELWAARKEGRDLDFDRFDWAELDCFASAEVSGELISLSDSMAPIDNMPEDLNDFFDPDSEHYDPERGHAIIEHENFKSAQMVATIDLITRELANTPAGRWPRWKSRRRAAAVKKEQLRDV